MPFSNRGHVLFYPGPSESNELYLHVHQLSHFQKHCSLASDTFRLRIPCPFPLSFRLYLEILTKFGDDRDRNSSRDNEKVRLATTNNPNLIYQFTFQQIVWGILVWVAFLINSNIGNISNGNFYGLNGRICKKGDRKTSKDADRVTDVRPNLYQIIVRSKSLTLSFFPIPGVFWRHVKPPDRLKRERV